MFLSSGDPYDHRTEQWSCQAIPLSSYIGPFLGAGFAYLILAFQLQFGFPPFYRSFPFKLPWLSFEPPDALEEELKLVLPFIFAMAVVMALYGLTEWRVLLVILGLLAIGTGLWVRQRLSRETAGPLPWLTSAWTLRWPMLVFDVWTLGLSSWFGLSILLSK